MSTQIKNNLFRFVTLRNPQLIDDKKKPVGFIYHPNENASQFFTAINGVNEEDKKAALLAEADNFAALKTKREAKNINETLYEFSTWLMLNKNHLTFVEIKEKALGIETLNSDQELLIWENLIYQTIAKKSVYVREALIQMLIANKFLLEFNKFADGTTGDITFTDDQEKEFIRRAHANVVISKTLFSGETKLNPATKKLTVSQQKYIDDAIDVNFAKTRVNDYELLLETLKTVEVSYNKSIEKTYQAELNKYNATVEELVEEATPVIVDEKDENGNIIKVKTYPDLKLPKFSFVKESGLTENYLKDKISGDNLNTFKTLGLEIYNEFYEAYKALNEAIKKENQIILDKSPKSGKKISIGGALFRSNTTSTLPNTPYCLVVRPGLAMNNKTNVYMYLATPSHTEVVEANYELTFNANPSVSHTGNAVRRVHGGGVSEHLGLILFEEGLLLINGEYTLTGEFTLNNGLTISFDINNFNIDRERKSTGSCATIKDGESTTEIINDAPVYGVTNLGIADFRRVEQEVCCYVPGEVSHIENVMAREYKERSTRSLTSSEITTERTDEVERENLTDTTSTERNEMQSEVASVLNEDKSKAYGANAGVSGGFGGVNFNAGAYLDVASSSSSSNSNSQAQTYAQEVTERAMERIVQKTQTKRTSRILKEFEENNKHGFDNTKGTEHVTGVYRWVDKIYKNTLINYGKRLMYEFAIPEPSKFFKEAIWKQVENEEIDSNVVQPEKPDTPNAIGLYSAASINEGNYQNLASKYGADVSAPLDQFIKIGKAFAKDNQEYSARGYAYNEISVPDGYYASQGTVQWSVIVKQNSNKHMSIALGDSRHTVIGGTGSTSFYNFSDKYKDNIPFSYGTWEVHSGHFSVTVDCVRTQEAYSQWQNETYTAIMDAYYERLQEYNDAQNQDVIPTSDKEELKFNPLYNRSLEKKELKRIAIELLTEQKGGVVSQNNYGSMAANGVSKVNKTAALQNHASTVKFFEQAFDWDIMAYIFYPYFYAGKDDWKDLFQMQDAADPLFQAFLQSGMARTVVPVRPGFEDAVNWYMETGEIWNGEGLTIDQDDDMYVSVAEEMQTVEGIVEGTWETRLPTALTVLQAGSIGLDVEGLPCDKDCDHNVFDSDGNPIKQTDTLIGGALDEVRHVENIDIVNGNLQLNTDDEPRQTVAQISIQALKNAIDSIA